MITGVVLLLGGAVVFAVTKLQITFLIPLGGYVIWRWGQNEQGRLEKARDDEELQRARAKPQKSQATAGAARKESGKGGAKKSPLKK